MWAPSKSLEVNLLFIHSSKRPPLFCVKKPRHRLVLDEAVRQRRVFYELLFLEEANPWEIQEMIKTVNQTNDPSRSPGEGGPGLQLSVSLTW